MFEPVFMRLALAASVASGLTLGVLGVYLVIRRIVFFGLVLANAATLGAAVAQALGWPPALVSLAAGLSAAAALGDVDVSSRVSNESLMGWAYAATSSATVLVLARAAGGSADTLQLLFGNVLAVQQEQVVVLVAMAAGVALVQLLFSRRFLLVTFDAQAAKVAGVNTRLWSLGLNLMIGAATAAAVYEIGALSSFALLALPSMSALLVTSSLRSTFFVAGALGAVVPALALAAAFYLDLPAGPACVALLAFGVAVAALWNRASSRRGGA
jgi:ABC-type Mn2+/Zn2+ transport system permease subunit